MREREKNIIVDNMKKNEHTEGWVKKEKNCQNRRKREEKIHR